jgi:hypothetical protein
MKRATLIRRGVRLMGETNVGLTHRTTCINSNSWSRCRRGRKAMTMGPRESPKENVGAATGAREGRAPYCRSGLPYKNPRPALDSERQLCANSGHCPTAVKSTGLSRQAGRKRRSARVPPGGPCTKAPRALLMCCCTPLTSSEGALQGAARVTVPPSLGRKVWLEPISEGF